MKLFKNQWFNIILGLIIVVMLMPQTRKPFQIFINKALAFSPSLTGEENRERLVDYNWVLESNNKERIEFQDYKGQVILINYWATWCPPCIAEMPSLQQLYEDYQDEVVFLFVSGEGHQTVKRFLERKNYTIPSFKMLTQNPAILDGRVLPTTYLIDREGNIVIKKEGAADWNSESVRNTLDDLLK